MKRGIYFLLIGIIILFIVKYGMCQSVDYSNISNEQKSELEQIIYDYLTRAETREKLVKAGLISPLSVQWDSGLRIDSGDGNFKLKIGGSIMNDWGWFSQDSATEDIIGDQVDGTEFRRARLYMSGEIYKNVGFKTEYDLAGSGRPDFKDVYINIKKVPYVETFQVGHFKEPFGLEELTSSKSITFMERGLNSVFSPSRNTGFMINNNFLGNRMTYAIGMFRNADVFGDSEGDSTTEGGYSFTGRITGLPYYEDEGKKLIHTGFSYSHQNAFEDTVSFESRPEMHLADKFVNTGSFQSEHLNLFNPELAIVYGPFSMQTEYTFANIGIDDSLEVDETLGTTTITDGGDNPEFGAWYVYGSYFLTGEHRKYKTEEGAFSRVKPYQNFDWNGGWGAIELTARYSELDLNDEEINGGRLADTTLGVNWYLNPNTRIMANYVHSDADLEEADNLNADMFAMRFQVDF